MAQDGTRSAATAQSEMTLVEMEGDGAYEGEPVTYKNKEQQLGSTLVQFLKDIDLRDTGTLSTHDLYEAADIVKIHQHAKKDNRTTISYKHFPESIRNIFEEWDTSANGVLSVRELQQAAKAYRMNIDRMKFLTWIVYGLVITVIVLTASNFVTSFMAVELAKEMKTGSNGVVTRSDGTPAMIASTDFTLENGTLISRAESESQGRRLSSCDASTNRSCGAPAAAIATRPAEVSRPLSSTIPDKLFEEMSKIKIASTDGVSSMTLHIVSFTRVLAPSRCGSLVYLATAHGEITLDDTELILDAALAAKASALGLTLAVSGGRRLASGALVAGLFNFFEDYDWKCESVQTPESPSKPMVINMLKRTPCPSHDACTSFMGQSLALPGVDSEESSAVSSETLVETDEYTLTVKKYANHPLQQLVSITDHVKKTHISMQVFKQKAYHCKEVSYAQATGNITDTLSSYFPAFMGRESRPPVKYTLPWGIEEVPARQVRVFRLQPKPDVDGALPLPVDYEDDVQTLLPTRLLFNGARDLDMDVEDILVQSIQQGASAADTVYQSFSNMSCQSDDLFDLPLMKSPLTEKKADVNFYVSQYIQEDLHWDTPGALTPYWIEASSREDSTNVQNASDGRRLLSRRWPMQGRKLQDLDGGFEVEIGKNAVLAATISKKCLTVAGSTSSAASPWTFSGELEMGKGCQDGSQFTIDGKVGITYGWSIEKDYKLKVILWSTKIKFECGLEIGGYIGGRTGSYTYDCGRRLDESRRLDAAQKTHENMSRVKPEDEDQEFEVLEYPEDEEAAEDQLEVVAPDIGSSRALLSGRRLSARRRRRRRRTCQASGFEILAGVGIGGGCSVSRRRIGVSLEGGLDLSLGPWPSPLDDRAKAEISAKGCIKIGPFKGCVGLPSVQLFDLDL